MKKVLFSVTLAIIALVFTACKSASVTASSAPTKMTLPATLATNSDALYYNKLLNQYIANPNLIPSKAAPKKTGAEKKEADKKMKKEFFESFKKAGLSKQQALQAYRKYQKNPMEVKELINLPAGSTSGRIVDNQSHTTMAGKKALTTKATKAIVIAYHYDTKEEILKKYEELSSLFKQMLPESQKWKLTDEKSTAKIFRDTVKRMEEHYNKYNGDYRIMPDPKKYKASIQPYRDLEEKTLKTPFIQLGYGWESDARIGGAITGMNMPNKLNIMIKPSNSKDVNSLDFDTLNVMYMKIIYK